MNHDDLADVLGIKYPSELQQIDTRVLSDRSTVELWCKRDDLLHDIISGNKWRKLQPILSDALRCGAKSCLSFGGAYSNHLHALAFCCHRLNISLTAIIRGQQPRVLSPTLQDLIKWGTHLHFVSRSEYKERNSPVQLAAYKKRFNTDIIVPEGGSNFQALMGMKNLVAEIKDSGHYFDRIYLPVGSGATLAGLIKYGHTICSEIIGVAVLKGENYLEDLIEQLLSKTNKDSKTASWQIEHRFHHGGYAKTSESLQSYIEEFEANTKIPLEKVYSAKCMFAINEHIKQRKIKPKMKILFLHTGGLQGKRKN